MRHSADFVAGQENGKREASMDSLAADMAEIKALLKTRPCITHTAQLRGQWWVIGGIMSAMVVLSGFLWTQHQSTAQQVQINTVALGKVIVLLDKQIDKYP